MTSPTGRSGTSEPNLQGFPVRTPEGDAIRRAFLRPRFDPPCSQCEWFEAQEAGDPVVKLVLARACSPGHVPRRADDGRLGR